LSSHIMHGVSASSCAGSRGGVARAAWGRVPGSGIRRETAAHAPALTHYLISKPSPLSSSNTPQLARALLVSRCEECAGNAAMGVTCDLSPWQLLLFSASGVRGVPVTSLAAAKLGPTCGLSIQGSPGFREPCLAKPTTAPATYHITLLVLGPLCD
jgi:hypothetical protein